MLGLGAFLSAFALSYGGTALLLRLGTGGRFIDVPNDRSSHEAPKPRFGGIAIVAAFMLVIAVVLFRTSDLSLLPFILGAVVIFAAGVFDDWRTVPILWRFGAQGIAVAIVVASGHVVHHIDLPIAGAIDLGALAVPFTVLFILASINFYNFIDGIDGLAAGSGLIAAAFLALIAFMLGHSVLALACLAVAGATAGFLQFNFPPSRLFMGDSGSTFLGFFFAYVAVSANRMTPPIPFFVPVLILSSLYLDAGLTLVRRALRGEKIFRAHKIHYYQRLLSLGLNHKQVTVIEYTLTVLLGISAVIYFKAGGFFPVFLMMCWAVIFTASILKVRSLERGDRMFWERRSLLVIGGDLVMIALAYFGAYFLRMNFRFTEAEGAAVLRAFPVVFVVRSACFFWYGLYRGMWKYTSTPDVLRIVKAVTTGSAIILALVVLLYRFVAFPRSLFVIEYVLLILMLGGSRFASRLFHEFGKDALGSSPRRIAVVGAGDYGEHVGREIRNTRGKTASVVCYVDDDKAKMGLVLRGVPVVGPLDELGDICRRFDVDELVLGISNLSDERTRAVVEQARAAGVPLEGGGVGRRGAVGLVELERVVAILGHEVAPRTRESIQRYFEGKRVLVVHGGHTLCVPLVSELLACGAHVTLQVDSISDAEAFTSIPSDRCRRFVSGFERELDVARVLEAANPGVVFHCLSLAAGGVTNADDYLWRRVVRSMHALAKVVSKHPIESLVAVRFLDDGVLDVATASSGFTTLGDVLALNEPGLVPLSPKVVRVPRVLTRSAVAEIANGAPAVGVYDVLETEVVLMCLGAAAEYKGRVILVPRRTHSISAVDISAALRRKEPSSPSRHETRLPLTAGEETKPSILAGAREVVSSLYPASDELFAWAVRCAAAPSLEAAREVVADFHALGSGRNQVPIDKSLSQGSP